MYIYKISPCLIKLKVAILTGITNRRNFPVFKVIIRDSFVWNRKADYVTVRD